ncbi:alanine--tRNA ligase-related protein [Bacillus sp. EB600]|uniref:alanyl-tRNA editing protein n=1 Tax=Bacillus sp. EB600 TaxID=2806345 RepID=UPI00210D0860|nr:alanine--tRNA ligase-related protein [Bacillus sp. EB600]MCQ6278943.1 alanyl-tRNA editing protein [Bacillus sp. EB600]
MKNKIFYQDAYIQTFSAKVVKEAEDSAGNLFVVLDQTAFYPTGGGQPHDTGTIGDVNVLNVEEIDGEILHFIEKPLQISKGEVVGRIDWQRRFDHMQQHAGQHILSAAFDNLFHYKTISFHLGNEVLTIDLDTDTLLDAEADQAERLANQIILENRSIETKWLTEAELSQYPLRKATKVKDDIRLVIIPDFDYNGCGGTHPKSTGEVRAIKLLDWEKQKKKIRLQFVCGDRVLDQFQQKQTVLLGLTKLLNAPEKDMCGAVLRMLQSEKKLEKSLEQAQEKLFTYEAAELIAESSSLREEKLVSKVFQGRTIQELQKLARLVTAKEQNCNVLFISENDNRLQVVCARGSNATENMKSLIGDALKLINGKGGGNEAFAQGGGEALISGDELLKNLLGKIFAKVNG